MNCKICDGKLTEEIKDCYDYYQSINLDKAPSMVYICENCKTGYTFPKLSEEEIAEYYPQSYQPYTAKKGIRAKLLENVKKKDIKKIKKHLLEDKSHTLFEFGAGNGEFLSIAKKSGFIVTGIDFSEYASKSAKENFDIEIAVGDAMCHTFKEKNDVIVMRHVLEHLDDFDVLMENITTNGLANKGTIFLKLPRFDSLETKIFKKYSLGLDIPRHRVHFSKMGIHTLLDKNGFCNIKILNEANPYDFIRSYVRTINNQKSSIKKILMAIAIPAFFIIMLISFAKPSRMIILANKGS